MTGLYGGRNFFFVWFHVRRAQQCEAGRKEQGERDEGKGGQGISSAVVIQEHMEHSFI